MWLDGFEYLKTSDGASWANDVADKLVLHTTQGGWDSAMSVFRRGNSPHFLVDPAAKRKAQLISLNRAAMALWNDKGGIETNRAGDVIQVEIVGFSEDMHQKSDDWYRWLAVEVIRPICDAKAIPPRITKFYGQGDGYIIATEGWVGRLDGDRFNNYAGILGHQTVGDGNDHWDPGKLPAEKLLMFAFSGGEIYDTITDTTRLLALGGASYQPYREGTLASNDEIMAKLNEIQNFLGNAFRGGVEVYPDADGVWRTAPLLDGRPTRGGIVVPQLTALVYEAATATRVPRLTVDYDQLADAIFRRLTKEN